MCRPRGARIAKRRQTKHTPRLAQARADLKLASELAPGDAEIRKEIAVLNIRMKEYKDKRWCAAATGALAQAAAALDSGCFVAVLVVMLPACRCRREMYRKSLAGAGAAEDDEVKGDEAGGEDGGEEGEGATGGEEGAQGDGEQEADGSGFGDAIAEGAAPSEEAAGGGDAMEQAAGTLPPRRNVLGTSTERPPPLPQSASDAGGSGEEKQHASNGFNPLIFLGIFGAIISIAGFFLMHYHGLISSAKAVP